MAPKLSVIVPVYNVESYLEDCINSILKQSFQDFELILVNDGSTDTSLSICEKIALIDPRVKVIDKENGGVSTARNEGINQALGDWICFVDSDDIINIDYFSNLMINIIDTELVLGGMTIIECETEDTKLVTPLKIIKSQLVDLDLLNSVPSLLLASPISKLFQRSIVLDNNLKFDERIHIGEDYLFVSYYLLCISNVSLIKNSDYIYYRRKGSLSTSYNNTTAELLAENELYLSTIKLYHKLGYKSKTTQNLYIQEFKKHAYRILFSLYKNRESNFNVTDRIVIIKSIKKDQFSRLKTMLRANGFKGLVLSLFFNTIGIRFLDKYIGSIITYKLK